MNEQREFVRLLIDGFVESVLKILSEDARFSRNFTFLDLRKLAVYEDDWFDEMHPTGDVFNQIAKRFAKEINSLLESRPLSPSQRGQ